MGVTGGKCAGDQAFAAQYTLNAEAQDMLNVWQYDGKDFKAKGVDNSYRIAVTPARGKRLLNISGINDELVSDEGGPSRGPAK